MIKPPGVDGVVFSEATDGDLAHEGPARHAFSDRLGISGDWATAKQVHGNRVLQVDEPGVAGDADGIWTAAPDLPLAVRTADCFGVAVKAPHAVGVAHAGWRGVLAGVVPKLLLAMSKAGHQPHHAYLGPGIGACCFEVGPEVSEQFPGSTAATSWGTESVDLVSAIRSQLDGLQVWVADRCTHHDPAMFSHRRSATKERLATISWAT